MEASSNRQSVFSHPVRRAIPAVLTQIKAPLSELSFPVGFLSPSAGTGTHALAAVDDDCAIVSFLACFLNGPTGSCLPTGLLKPLKRPALHERRFLTSQFQIPPSVVLRTRTAPFFRRFITQPHSPTLPSRRGFFRRAKRWRVTTTTTI